MDRSIIARTLFFVTIGAALTACGPKEDPYKLPENKSVDLHEIKNTMSEEELVEARKAAGLKSREQEEAEAAVWYETEMRKYIKARLPDYRKLVADMRTFLDEIEKQAPKWKSDAAFEKFSKKHKEKVAEYWKFYDETTGKGGEGGKTQIDIQAAAQAFEQLNDDLRVDVAANEAFPGVLEEIRGHLEKVEAALDDIEKDESLDVGETEGEPEGEGEAKDAPKK